ncbi:MAG: hypothetical protein ACRBBK_00235 [Paracoccaceae bacterium]
MRTIIVEHDYPVAPAALWAIVTDYQALAYVMKGLIAFEGLPQGRAYSGQAFWVQVSLFGRFAPQPYFMEVLECDEARMLIRSREKGAGVKSWHHRLQVSATAHGSRLSDRIEIEAGLLTPLFALWARYLYRARHKPRCALLGL